MQPHPPVPADNVTLGNKVGMAFSGSDLRKIYRTGETEVHALRGVDLAIPQGELQVFLGPSGSGKSTLLNIIGGLDRPTSGKLYCEDIELSALGDRELTRFRRAHVGFIFQFYNLIPGLTAEEKVCLAVWMCFAARNVTGKILSIIFPVAAFVALGFEHSIANMYLLPVAMLHMDGRIDVVAMLANLVPVTAGNVVGGGILVALFYWLVYLRRGSQEA